jgi:hypothetical protein
MTKDLVMGWPIRRTANYARLAEFAGQSGTAVSATSAKIGETSETAGNGEDRKIAIIDLREFGEDRKV